MVNLFCKKTRYLFFFKFIVYFLVNKRREI
nr:MAG TPA: hypothetical protein [Caudoviricetes sp.]